MKDLVQARDLFHYHLINKRNVVATAIGLYRIRKNDPWPSEKDPSGEPQRQARSRGRRTLYNSEIRRYSWPCVYAFVSEWKEEVELAKEDPSDVVPKTLYLPDGRTVPVCVIEARRQSIATDLQVNERQLAARNILGPGSALINDTDAQGLPRLATAGCIVRDSERYYVLTNRHALGAAGTRIKATRTGERFEVGSAATKELSREDFHAIYPNFASHDQRLLMDIGLVDVDDITRWKTDVPGISPIAPVLDLYDNRIGLSLLQKKVVGHSAVSGALRGEIHALFFRYKSVGGTEYVSDFLIGPNTGRSDERVPHKHQPDDDREQEGQNVAFAVHHGDSGTLLFIEQTEQQHKEPRPTDPKLYHPFGVLWGKEEFFEDGLHLAHPFALATSLATVLDRLDLDLVRDINSDQEYIWGWVGHYVIGGALPLGLDLLKSAKLKTFVQKNLDLLTITPKIESAKVDNDPRVGGKADKFVPLADVPDNVWKSNVNNIRIKDADGKTQYLAAPGSRARKDNPNHFADIDMAYKGKGTFIEYCLADLDATLKPQVWVDYFNSYAAKYKEWETALFPDKKPKPLAEHWGALPFRVWQLFEAMVNAKSAAEFLCAGGVLIHYVGDACQPLHTSYLSQGDPDRVLAPSGKTPKMEADGVHSGYEDDMVNYGYQEKQLAAEIETAMKAQAKDRNEAIRAIATGLDAAKAIMELISATHETIAPKDIVAKWVQVKDSFPRHPDQRNDAMWQAFGDGTITCMARGARVLAAIWNGAWAVVGDSKFSGKVTSSAIQKLYENQDFVPSIPLNQYDSVLQMAPAPRTKKAAAGRRKH